MVVRVTAHVTVKVLSLTLW